MKERWKRSGRIVGGCILLLALPGSAREEDRNRAWLIRYLTQPPPDAPRTARYIDHMNRHTEPYCGVNVDFLTRGTSNALEPGRSTLNSLARLAYSHRTKGFKYFGDEQAWQRIRDGLLGVSRNIRPDGKFTWGMKGPPSHELCWYLEASLFALIWAEDRLKPEEVDAIRDSIRRTAEVLCTSKMADGFASAGAPGYSNQGSVWCATVALAALYFERPDWMAVAKAGADRLMLGGPGNIFDDGEIGEHQKGYANGGGPDCNYTYTAVEAIYHYRLFSGRSEIDGLLTKASHWLVGYNTLSGVGIIPGASARKVSDNPHRHKEILVLLEWMSKKDPFYARVAELAMQKMEKHHNGFDAAGSAIFSMLEGGLAPRDGAPPAWQADRTEVYGVSRRQAVGYALFSRASYQTGSVFRNGTDVKRDWPLKGMQTFAWKEELPILAPSAAEFSTTRADGVDTARAQVADVDGAWEVVDAKDGTGLATVTARRGALWEMYVCTPGAFVVVHGGARGDLVSRWALSSTFVPAPKLVPADRTLTHEGREGRIFYLRGEAKLADGNGAKVLEVTAPGPTQAFGFSDGAFRFQPFDPSGDELKFADASGAYRLSLAGVTVSGRLAQGGPLRLVRTGEAPPPSGKK